MTWINGMFFYFISFFCPYSWKPVPSNSPIYNIGAINNQSISLILLENNAVERSYFVQSAQVVKCRSVNKI